MTYAETQDLMLGIADSVDFTLRGVACALHGGQLGQLLLGSSGEPLPVVPALERFAETAHRDECKPELAMRRS